MKGGVLSKTQVDNCAETWCFTSSPAQDQGSCSYKLKQYLLRSCFACYAALQYLLKSWFLQLSEDNDQSQVRGL